MVDCDMAERDPDEDEDAETTEIGIILTSLVCSLVIASLATAILAYVIKRQRSRHVSYEMEMKKLG